MKTTERHKALFFKTLAKTCNVQRSCRKSGISSPQAYKLRKEDESFRQRWDDALEEAMGILESKAYTRASKTSDVLLIFLLKAHNPDKYRDRHDIDLHGNLIVELVKFCEDDSDPNPQ